MIESLVSKIEGLTSDFKNQMSFNKMLEIQLAQIDVVPTLNSGKILRNSLENVNAVTTRIGRTTWDPPNPKHVGMSKVQREPSTEEEPRRRTAPHEFYDPNILQFPHRNRKPSVC